MSFSWMLVVLFAAALHASWNAIIKAGSDKFNDTILVLIGAALFPGFLLPWIALPTAGSWPYLVASVIIHFAYFSLIALAYRVGDLSYAYPIMRGVAPMLTALVASVAIGDPLSSGGKMGIVLLSLGILTLTSESWWTRNVGFTPTAVALTNAVVISMYTVVDGIGLRLAGDPVSYICWLFFLQPVPFIPLLVFKHRERFMTQIKSRWSVSLLGGLCTCTSYGLAMYAMAFIPIALVAALRETSVIFGAIIAAVFLHERFGPIRYIAAGLVTAGAVVMKVF
jgi:drug/metabolite transporter (DMT)-like permease